MKAFWHIFIGILFPLGFFGSYSLTWQVLDRTPPIIYERAVALSPSVPQGGTLDVEFDVFRERICPTIAKRWVVDSMLRRHSIPQFTTGLKLLAGRETYRRTITIPQDAATGRAYYYVTLDYFCNVFHNLGFPITVVSPSIYFEITPGLGLVPFGFPPPPPMTE